jgi:hypothetical protein
VGRFTRPIDAFETNEKPSFCHANFSKTPILPVLRCWADWLHRVGSD